MVIEILTEWQHAGTPPSYSVMHYDDMADVAVVRANVADLWNALEPQLVPGTTWTVLPDYRQLDTASGALVGFGNEPTAHSGAGSNATTNPVPDATQLLLRWQTDGVARGRRVLGRTYVPGASAAISNAGNVNAAAVTAINNALATYVAAAIARVVWSRPVLGAGGSAHPLTGGSVWSEWAVQRGRRS